MTKKRTRANGEGSIYKRASDGIWCGAYFLPSGKRKVVYGKTRGTVVQKLERARSNGPAAPDERQTVEAFLKRWWADTQGTLRPSSRRVYESMLRLHVYPQLGRHRLARLEPRDFELYFAERIEAGLAPKTVSMLKAILSSVFNDAMRWGEMTRNPVTYAELPKANKERIVPMTPDEARAIITAFRGSALAPLVTAALGTGLRQGELLALRWQDVDFEARTVRVEATLQNIDGKFQRLEPKTEGSYRLVPLTPFAYDAFEQQRENQTAARLLCESWANDMDLVFTSDTGQPMWGATVTRAFQAKLDALGLPKRRFHELRHGFATLMLAQGVSTRTIMEMLGHTSLKTTALTYTHVVPELMREAADKLGELLR